MWLKEQRKALIQVNFSIFLNSVMKKVQPLPQGTWGFVNLKSCPNPWLHCYGDHHSLVPSPPSSQLCSPWLLGSWTCSMAFITPVAEIITLPCGGLPNDFSLDDVFVLFCFWANGPLVECCPRNWNFVVSLLLLAVVVSMCTVVCAACP
jgi:hypothetical protein